MMRSVDWRVVAAAATVMIVEGYDLSVYGILLPVMSVTQTSVWTRQQPV